MPVQRKIPPLPEPHIPLVDPNTGTITVEWYRWFVSLIAVLNEMLSAIP